jgi:RNA polymerase sigma factor (sigma-70 family)
MQQDDWVNWTPDHCKRKIHEYQVTKDKELFSMLLAKYDKFLLKLTHSFNKQFYDVTLDDLYHSAIVGFEDALIKFKQQAPSRLIIAIIKAYVKREIEAHYRDMQKYENKSYRKTEDDDLDPDDTMDASFILNSYFLNDNERAFLKLRFEDNMSFEEMAKSTGLCRQSVSTRLKKILNKIRKRIEREETR